MKKLLFIAIFCLLIPFHKAEATAYYINFQCADTATCGNGLATTTSFSGINEFADAARNANDIAFVRRGVASTTGISDVSFTSDGNLNNPIVITADYDNLWGDFASSSVTFTPVFGSKFMATSASTTDAFPNKWIYVQGDCSEVYNRKTLNPCEYAYEIKNASSTGIELFLPYKGPSSGAGKNVRVMPSAPQWNTTAGDFQWNMSRDNNWVFKGIGVYGTDSVCNLNSLNSNTVAIDMVFQGDGTSDCGIRLPNTPNALFKKIRGSGHANSLAGAPAGSSITITDAYFSCNATFFVDTTIGDFLLSYLTNVEVSTCTSMLSTVDDVILYTKNFIISVNPSGVSGDFGVTIFNEDIQGVVSQHTQISSSIANNADTIVSSTSTSLRTEGGPTNLYVIPPAGTGDTGISTGSFPQSYMKLFEYPIYTDTSSKTYSMFFKTATSGSFTIDPLTATASGSSTPEMYIECEYYADASDADRMLKRSNTANDVDFNGSTDWQDISVTCQPTQSGILYLRGWYAKPREGATNQFYMDTTPVIQ